MKRFVIQKHDASHLHYDFRIEHRGVLKSWAIPKQPPLRSGIKRLAMPTPDHALSYINFEGIIPEGKYGAGTVEIWDKGTYENITQEKNKHISLSQALKAGKVELNLHGEKLKGGYALIRTQPRNGKENWLFLKMKEKIQQKKARVK